MLAIAVARGPRVEAERAQVATEDDGAPQRGHSAMPARIVWLCVVVRD